MIRSLWILLGLLLAISCQQERLSDDPVVVLDIPAGFPEMEIPTDNGLTESRVALGKTLFYEPLLSLDSSISCASCHQQSLAFADDQSISPGVAGRIGFRNAPSLANIGYHPAFNKDGGVPTLELQALVPLEDHNEMSLDAIQAANRLNNVPSYIERSVKAYGRLPDAYVITRALAAFQRTLISGDSDFDRYVNQGAIDALTPAEERGLDLFKSARLSCSECHSGFDLTDYEFRNNGLPEDPNDTGRQRVTFDPKDAGLFKTPSLRNIALTAPYMHDGRYETLEEVIEHYNRGGEAHPNKSPLIRPLNLTDNEKADLLAFLQSLTDESFLNNPDFQPE